jgi:hypothetical protein
LIYYLEFGDYCRIAAEVLGVEPEQVAALPNIGLGRFGVGGASRGLRRLRR